MTCRLFMLACVLASAAAAAMPDGGLEEAVAAAERDVRSRVAHLREVELRIKKSLGLRELEPAAAAARQNTKSRYEELAEPIRAAVRTSGRHRALQERFRLAEAHLRDVRRSPSTGDEVTAALGGVLRARLELEELENRAVLEDEGAAVACARFMDAENRLARIRGEVHSAFADDAEWRQANGRLEQARKRLAELFARVNAERGLVKPLR
jgi:hypothetical protein